MKPTPSRIVTLDGEYQGPGRPDDNWRGGFERDGSTAARSLDADADR
jgi:hypothetical protein